MDLSGLIELLSRSLYSSPGVYLRELVQNGVDAIAAGTAVDPDAPAGRIRISPYGVESDWSPATEFAIVDEGIGVSMDEVAEFLATVGASSKRQSLAERRLTYLGQFGIGLLSCFLVAEDIVVVSRRGRQDAPIEWIGHRDGTYHVRELTEDLPRGTTVTLRPKSGFAGWLRCEQVVPLVQAYAEFVSVQITVETPTGPRSVSRTYPWLPSPLTHKAEILAGASPVFGGVGAGRQVDVVHVSDPQLGLDGVIYVASLHEHGSIRPLSRAYVGGMLVDADAQLLPDWAFFAWAVVSSHRLEPTASRESLVASPALDSIRDRLGSELGQWLRELAGTDPERFEGFVEDHALRLRMAATQGAGTGKLELAEAVLPMLRVATTEGVMRLGDVVRRDPHLLYAASVDEFRVMSALVPHGRIVINAGHALDQEVLLTLAQLTPGVRVTRVYAASEAGALLPPPPDSLGDALALEQRGSAALEGTGTCVVVRCFPFGGLSAVHIASGVVDARSPHPDQVSTLVLNWDNKLVAALARLADPVVLGRVIQVLYVQARMAAQDDRPEDRRMLESALGDILALAVGADGELA